MLRKWRPVTDPQSLEIPDNSYSNKFHHTFRDPLSSSKRLAMRELFPGRRRWTAALADDV
jgi:hypothetical protein